MPLAYQPDDRSSHHAPQQADRGGLTGINDLTSMSARHHDVPYWLVLPQAYGSMFGWSFQDQTQPLFARHRKFGFRFSPNAPHR